MVIQLPIPKKSTAPGADDSSAIALQNRDVVAGTPITSNLASGVYPIGSYSSGVQRPNLSSNVNLNLQSQQLPQQVAARTAQNPLQISSLAQQIVQPQTMQRNPQIMSNNMVGSNTSLYANSSLYNFNANQMMMSQYNQQILSNPQQVISTATNNAVISSNMNNITPWMRMGGGQPNPLGKVTVGGRSSILNGNSGDGIISSSNNNNSSSNNINNNSVMSVLGARSRMEVSSPRPPLPTTKSQLSTMANTLQPAPSKVVNFEELPASALEDGANNEVDYHEAALTTELLSLSVHEALAFDGVELALHPDLFKDSSRNKDGRTLGLQPGDLVEIRVWSARPDVIATKSKSNNVATKTKGSAGKTSLHSRNTSLASATSSIFSTASLDSSLHQTPVPNEVFRDTTSNTKSGMPPIQSSISASLETPQTKQGANITTSSTSTLLAGAASTLFRNTNSASDIQSPPSALARANIPSQNASVSSSESSRLHGTSLDDSTLASHSRDSSLLTNSTLAGIHSRDSSFLGGMHSRESSLINALGISSGSPTNKESPTNSPQPQLGASLAMEAVEEGQPHHPIITNLSGLGSQIESHEGQPFPARRDGSSLATPAGISHQLQNEKVAVARTETISSSTPVSTTPPSISKSSTINNKSPSNKSPSQRPPVALPPEQSRNANKAKQTTSHVRNDSISSALPTTSSGAMTGPTSHRRHNSSIPASSSTAPLLPPGHRVNTRSSKNTGVINRDNSEDGMGMNVLESLQETHFVRISFVMPVSEESLKSIKSSARTKVSLLRRVADLYQITGFDTVTVTQIPRRDAPFVQQQISADFVTITFKDQFVSRGDMYYFQRSFLNSWVYEGKRLSFNGIRTNTKVIRHGDHAIRSGIISEDTKLTFRSRSARIIWLVQMSSEMWDFASPYKAVGNQKNKEPMCETYFNKFITFARKLFEKWKKLELTHNLTVVFFSRTYVRHKDFSHSSSTSAIRTNSEGRMYCDNYKIVLNNETKTDWNNLIYRMKQAFVSYPKEVKWDLTPGMERTPSTASQGNILEAINMTLNLLHLHFIDRDLHRTGNSIVIMTAGNGVFEVEKNLAGITKQRMMDNGIGSDMLSLGLPPLHVIPFFLFRNENTENTAEEMQGFDDDGGATSSFEVPHWMNLSYVDYDDEEEAMLYKEHVNDDADDINDEHGDDDVANTPWNVSNGFLRRNKQIHNVESVPTVFPKSDKTATAKDHAKHLISQRGFEDILQACRPRNRGEYGSGLPMALANLLKKSSSDANHSMQLSEQMTAVDHLGGFSPQRSSRAKNLEWGAVSFDEFNMNKIGSSLQRSQFYSRMSASLSDSSSASSFTSIGSYMLVPQSASGMHLQSTTSLSLDAGQNPTLHHDDSSASLDVDGENPQDGNPISMIERMMREHDEHAFSGRSGRVSPTNSTFASSFNSGNAGSPKIEGISPIARSQSAMLPSLMNKSGGIEAALAQYDDTSDLGAGKPSAAVPATSDKRLSTSPIISSIPLTFSLDRRSEGYNPNYNRIGQDKISAITEGLQPLDISRRALIKGLGDRRSSFAHGSSKQQVTSDNLSKAALNNNRNKPKTKHSYQQRYRRKVWVLNPFRQEDEDEVLAKRTHNRRRWSHVFPLGEAEFKKHAGPNWKSLCQPAILPMTIDFHPDPAELQDRDKFRIKQYSVTLPSMEETNYKDATELLDDLMVQRIRQDFQLVPRSILSAHRETDNTSEHTLSRTLSMGHKIQKLSYNPSSDSVDVVSYYANFAENESPQSYRYLLWSALRQDYVSVVQTFTKYTSPYKWNELDMLISGDSISSISEDMRHPRISFVILPDSFTDQGGESEYSSKFQRLVEYFNKLQKKGSTAIEIETNFTSDKNPNASRGKRSFIVDLRRRNSDKYEWCEIVHDSNCDTRRTFRITIQWLVTIGSKIDQQAQLLHRRCAQYGLNLIRVPSYSSLRLCFLNPFAVPITIPVKDKSCVDKLEEALINDFDFVYDDSHMADPNELVDYLDGFDFVVNRWSMNKRKKFVPAKQYLHRTGTLFVRFLRDAQGKAIVIIYLNNLHIAGDSHLMDCARSVFNDVEQFITENS